MKKFISLLCIAAILVAALAVGSFGASAATSANTIVDVKAGDTVTYVLNLGGCNENLVCADYSVYYDSSVLMIDAIADYNNSYDEAYWGSVINTDLKDEITANFINVGRGIDFSQQRPFISVKFTAIADATTHINYYIRDMAGNSYFDDPARPQIKDYLFTCDVSVNDKEVLTDAQPELNTEKAQEVGSFVNSVNGKSEDADFVATDKPGENGYKGNTGNNGNNGGNSGNAGASEGGVISTATPTSAVVTDADGSVIATQPAAQTEADGKSVSPTNADGTQSTGGSSSWLWIVIIVIVVLGGGGCAAYFMTRKKKA